MPKIGKRKVTDEPVKKNETRSFEDQLDQGKEFEEKLLDIFKKTFKTVQTADDIHMCKFPRKLKIKIGDYEFYKSTPDLIINDNGEGVFVELKSFNSELLNDKYKGNSKAIALREDQLEEYYTIQRSTGLNVCLVVIVMQPKITLYGITIEDFLEHHYEEYYSNKNHKIYFKTLEKHFIELKKESEMVDWIIQHLQSS